MKPLRSRPALAALAAAVLAGIVLPAAAAPAPRAEASGEGPAFRRFALVAGTNDGGGKRVRLRYAASDAATFSEVLVNLGGVRPEDLILLKGPTRAAFLEAMEELRKRIAAAETGGGRSELLVYYSGHSDESGLLLGEEKVRYAEFRARIDAVPARIRLAVVDACASGALTRLKGGRRLPAFAVDQSSSLSGYAFLTSSSGNESAQESDRIRASFFTHYLVTGMRGAADLNLDGRVSLSEAYEFAFHETLSQTEGSQAGAQHPSYDMRLTGTGDLVLTDLRGTSAGVVLDRSLQGRLFVRSSTGALVAELQKQPGRKVELGLEPGLYDLGLDQGNAYYRSLFKVDTLTHHPVALKDFARAPREWNRERGDDTAQGFDGWPDLNRRGTAPAAAAPALSAAGSGPASGSGQAAWIPARAAFYPALGFPGRGAGPWSHNFSFNLFAGEARSIHGLQFSLLHNRSRADLSGLQLTLGFNLADGPSRGAQIGALTNAAEGGHRGLQLAFGANMASDLVGVQFAGINLAGRAEGVQGGLVNASDAAVGTQVGLINGARRDTGLQVGLLNLSGRGVGLQAGVVNGSGRARGAQIGVLNVAREITGLQLGLVNIAPRADGAVIGALNLIGNGLHDLETTVDEKSMLRTALLLGGSHNYTWYAFDMKALKPRHLWGGSGGLGLQLPRDPFFLGFDLGAGWLSNEEDWDNYSVTGRLRTLMGYRPMRYFSVFGGLTYNFEAWPGTQRPNLNPGSDGEAWGDDIRAERWTGFFLGVRL